MLKRTVSLLLCLCMLLCCVPVASAEETIVDSGTCGENATWALQDGVLTISGTGEMYDYSLETAPWFDHHEEITTLVIEEGVTYLGVFAFYWCPNLVDITIPASVTAIGKQAFGWCHGLTSFTIPATVTDLGSSIFSGCSNLVTLTVEEGNPVYYSAGNCIIITETGELRLGCNGSVIPNDGSITAIDPGAFFYCTNLTSVTIPDGITAIGSQTFWNCNSLTEINIPSSVTDIGFLAFGWCGLTQITIPASVTSIGGGIFCGCFELSSITVEEGNPNYSSVDNCLIDRNSGTLIASNTAGYIPDDGSVTVLGQYSLGYCTTLTEPVIPDTITRIEKAAFAGCFNITSITIPASVTSIGEKAFLYCDDLTDVYFGGTEEQWEAITLGEGNDCLTNATIHFTGTVFVDSGTCGDNLSWTLDEDYVLTISGTGAMADYSFASPTPWHSYQTQITSVVVENGCTGIGNHAFFECTGLTSVTLPESVSSIGGWAFWGCSALTSVRIPEGVTDIGYGMFFGCTSLTDVTLPDSLTSIGEWAFSGCTSLKNITIPEGVTSIATAAFYDCTDLTGIAIPGSVTSIGSIAFGRCPGLTSLSVENGNSVYHSAGNCIIETATNTLVVGCRSSIIPSDGSVTGIGNSAFYYCTSLTAITIPDNITRIGASAFCGCNGLSTITVPASVTELGAGAFFGCNGLTSMKVADGNPVYHSAGNCIVETASRTLIVGCNVSQIPGDGSVTKIGDNAFCDLQGLTEYAIPEGITSIGYGAFSSCANLTGVTLPSTLTFMDGNVFNGCNSLVTIVIPEGVTSIEGDTFVECYSLTSVTIPASVTSIGMGAFADCENLKDVYYGGSEKDWEAVTIDQINDCLTNATIHFAKISGTCGEDLTWTLEDGVLTISGTGSMKNYDNWNNNVTPWCSYWQQITSVVVGKGATAIGDYAFSNCNSLTSVSIPDSVTTIGDHAFSYCSSLTSITIPDNVTSIGNWAFLDCSNLTGVTIPESVTSIGEYAFSGCTSLTDVYYGGTEEDWGKINIKGGNDCLTNATIHFAKADLTIVTQPEDQILKVGETATFTVEATGDDLSYQWQYRTGDTGSWKNSGAASATTATFTVKATAARNGYQYRCVITDGNGNEIATDPATLSVLSIATHPADATVSVGEKAKFTVSVTGADLTYQWQYRTNSSGSWKDSGASDAKTNTLSIKATAARNGYQYRCKVTDGNGNTVYSNAATLTVSSLAITGQPTSVTVSAGTTAKFSVTATGDGLSYQWQYRTNSAGSWKDSGATSATSAQFSVKATAARNGYQYRCRVTDSAGNEIYSNAATLTVSSLSITGQPADATVSVGEKAKFSVTATGDGLSYQWQYRTNSSGSWKNSGASDAKTNTLSIKATAARNGYQYRCKVTDGSGNVVYSNAATLTVSSLSITTQPTDATVSVGEKAKFTVTATGDDLSYQWQYRTNSSGSWKNSGASDAKTNTLSIKATAARNGYQYRCVVTDGNGNVVYTSAATLNVN